MKLTYNKSRVSEEEIVTIGEQLSSYAEHLKEVLQHGYEDEESSINLPSDKELMESVGAAVRDKNTTSLKYILVIGIGGSNLGTKAIYDALYGHFDILEPSRMPKMIFLDTTNPAFLAHLESFFDKEITNEEEVVINVISKGGSTTETVVNAELALGMLRKKYAGIMNRLVVTTDFGSLLWKIAEEKDITRLSIPEKVGGRYSVLSAVGLFPLAKAGVNVTSLLSGALEMRERCLSLDIGKNPAMASAAALFINYRRGKTINDNFIFHPELESLGKWYRQLLGESIGKEHNREGEVVHIGITPTISIGSTDLHSVGQLYLGGPEDKLTTFISAEYDKRGSVVTPEVFAGVLSGVAGKKPADVAEAILKGVKIAYEKKGLPFMEALLPDITPASLGAFMQFKMMEMMYLGQLFNVNPFDQPNVELYKIETKNILNS
ncbi:MAG: hypothetical protein NUV49_02780 [Patescibacteria group bacterium]|nr:hypothetical protein [Patescibacteria group bacterium]